MHLLLDHTIVGHELIDLNFDKERPHAGCCICGAVFQPWTCTKAVPKEEYDADPMIALAAEIEIREWRTKHSKKHTPQEHAAHTASGFVFSPEAAQKLAPYGYAPIADGMNVQEVAQAMYEAPRAPTDDPETTLKGLITVKKGL